jgi:hypothetical protein
MSEISQLSDAELLEFVEKVALRCKERKISVIAGAPLRLNPDDLSSITLVLPKRLLCFSSNPRINYFKYLEIN